MAALSGVRVIDLTQFEAGTSCTEALAWLGADILKVEPPNGEQGRHASVDVPGLDSWYFVLLNANKRSVTLDLRTPAGRDILRRLVEIGDVFVENFAPGTIERLGFDYDTVRNINPRIIYAQVKGFDPNGPYGRFKSFDSIGQATGGATGLTGDPDRPPVRPGPNFADTGSGLQLSLGIVSALFQRTVTGEGQRVSITLQESVINFCRMAYARQLMSGTATERSGNLPHLHTAPAGTFPCKPGGSTDYCAIYLTRASNDQWRLLLNILGRTDLDGDPRFRSPEDRFNNRVTIDEMLSNWTRQYTKVEVMERLGQAGIPAGAVFDTMELSTDSFLRSNGTFVAVTHSQRGEFVMPGSPLRMSASSVAIVSAPLLGEHNQVVYRELLGFSEADLVQLHDDGVI